MQQGLSTLHSLSSHELGGNGCTHTAPVLGQVPQKIGLEGTWFTGEAMLESSGRVAGEVRLEGKGGDKGGVVSRSPLWHLGCSGKLCRTCLRVGISKGQGGWNIYPPVIGLDLLPDKPDTLVTNVLRERETSTSKSELGSRFRKGECKG